MFNTTEFKAQMVRKNLSGRDVAKALGINEATFYRKLRNDGSFTRGEIDTLIRVMDIANPSDIFFATKLA